MKQLIEHVVGIKVYICLIFSGEILLYMVLAQWFAGIEVLPIALIWQFLAIAVIIPILQWICFGTVFLKRTRYYLRILLFTIKLGCVLALFAWGFAWFPADDLKAWLIFGGIFLVAELAIGLAMEVYYRITGQQYTQQLKLYKEARHSQDN